MSIWYWYLGQRTRSFRHPQKATDTEMTDEGILLRYRDSELVGVTILDASARL